MVTARLSLSVCLGEKQRPSSSRTEDRFTLSEEDAAGIFTINRKAHECAFDKTVDEYLQVMTVDQAKMVKIDFGKFSGWTLGDIAMKSPGDLAWYVKNYSGHNLALKAGAIKLLEAAGQMAS